MKIRNHVAKYMNKFNKAKTYTDKKKQERKEPTLEYWYLDKLNRFTGLDGLDDED